MARASPVLIHVNRHHLQLNARDGGQRPVYTAKHRGRTTYAQGVRIHGGTVELIDPRTTPPLKCGARAYLRVTGGEVEYTEPCRFSEAGR